MSPPPPRLFLAVLLLLQCRTVTPNSDRYALAGTIVGCLVGVIGVVVITLLLCYMMRRRRSKAAMATSVASQPPPAAEGMIQTPRQAFPQQPSDRNQYWGAAPMVPGVSQPPPLVQHPRRYPPAAAQKPADQVQEDEQAILFGYKVLNRATNNFAESNILGTGCFGPVYKGKLRDGRQVAIKRLATGSSQGVEQLIERVRIVMKLQHEHLAKVVGYCLEENETMLVYEFLHNTSLDKYLADSRRSEWLTWPARFKIIKGISKGLHYLHDDSWKGVKIIHRDLKTSNILLDENMNPKIADYGLARIHGDHQTLICTTRDASTFGYLPPEYISEGAYSAKTDVYSFGIILLEIVTGKMVHSFKSLGRGLIEHVKWNRDERQPLQALDPRLGGVCTVKEVELSIHIGLLCSKHDANERPDMAAVVEMLNKQVH